jgi:Domain of unknown function (DUF5615)
LRLRFQADANVDPAVVRGLKRREPAIDFREAAGTIPDGTPDSEVLRIAAEEGRVLVSGDVATLPGHFARFVAEHDSPGLVLIPSRRSIGEVIEGIMVVWLNWSPEELRNRARWLPYEE